MANKQNTMYINPLKSGAHTVTLLLSSFKNISIGETIQLVGRGREGCLLEISIHNVEIESMSDL